VALYAAGVVPTITNMTLVGIALGAAIVLVRVALRRPAAASLAAVAPTILAITAASGVIGSMY
jgi:hypothetical protein